MLQENIQGQMTIDYYGDLYDILIETDNFWRKLNEIIDYNFIYEELEKTYSKDMGRPAENPIRMFKYILLKTATKLSDRDLVKKAKVDMEMKYFLGYAPEELKLINPSLLSKFRKERLKDISLLDMMIQKTVEIALEKGIIEVQNKLIQDSTHSNAMFQHVSPREELATRAKEVRKAVYAVAPAMKEKMPEKKELSTGLLEDTISYCKKVIEVVENEGGFEQCTAVNERLHFLEEGLEETETEYSKDKDAMVGHKTADTSFFGYKTHIAMTPERIITAATITSGEKHDGKELQKLVEKSEVAGIKVEAVIGDGAYSEKDNIKYMKDRNIKLVSKLSKTVTHGNRKNEDKFSYNKDAQMYVCKAGHMAIRKSKSGSHSDKNGIDTRVENYFFDVDKCKRCPFKEGCYKEGAKTKTYSVKIKSDIHIEHMEYMKSDEFQELSRERYKIEAKNAELKRTYDYGTAKTCGLLGMTIQGATTIFMSNMKRIIKLDQEQEQK